MSDIGEGLDQPIMELGADFCIFEVDDGYMMRQFEKGDVQAIPADVSDEFWEKLRSEGWTDVDY